MHTSYFFAATVVSSVLGLVHPVARQEASSSGRFQVITIFPAGPQTYGTELESTQPIVCDEGCYYAAGNYVSCFIGPPIPGAPPVNQTACDQYSCNATHFDQLSQCLNCIVANGNERPFGYYTNTSITAQQTGGPGRLNPNPNGLIDASLANKMLANVTSRCAAVGSTLSPSATTITATPTTTGPYYTSYTSGQEVTLTVWTGLQSYTFNNVVTATVIQPTGLGSASGIPSGTGSMSAASGPSAGSASAGAAGASNSMAASAAASSSSSTSAARPRLDVPGVGVGIFGLAITVATIMLH